LIKAIEQDKSSLVQTDGDDAAYWPPLRLADGVISAQAEFVPASANIVANNRILRVHFHFFSPPGVS
jgi:hypothetical protein